MLGASRWVVLSAGFGHVLRLLGNLILTRLLIPDMFGLMSIATTAGVILFMLSDIGSQQAVIRSRRGDEPAFLDTVWTIQVIRGFLLWGASVVVAVGLSLAARSGLVSAHSTYGDPILPWLIVATGLPTAVSGLASTLSLSSIRSFQMRPVFLMNILSQAFGLIIMIGLAWLTRSVWALVLGSTATYALAAVLSHLWMRGPRNRLRWDRSSAYEVFSYGKWLAVSSAVTVFASNGDRLLLAAYSSPATLGLYSIALALVSALDTVLVQLFSQVMLPAFSEVARNDPSHVPPAYFRLRRRIDPIILIASGLLFGGAHLLIGVLYDKRYAGAAEMLQILALGMIVNRYTLVQQVYLAIGQTRYFVSLNATRLVSTFTLIPLGFHFGGFLGALIAISCRDVPMAILTLYLNSRHRLNDLRLEVGTLVFWPAGFLLARGAEWIVNAWKGST